ncbi:hypothetical protein BT96DRAFT_596312 [Gymnopus androsaceus JB14]|uniref:SUN domain-containing protein n=1 Tax=Gymnopus androsaceus JB14 TaxID=1447944 RepID=A0A6A4HTI3_9AGAR|nr:hypothetical protein BT96DRAFT_596312 [Gymnopus androsaceus JB14]
MTLFSVLPVALVAFILASPAFSALISPNDPFKAISALEVREPEPPVCCLTPLPPVEPVEDEILLSFEEWKEKQAALHASTKANGKEKHLPNRTSPHLAPARETASPIAEKVLSTTLTEVDISPDSDNGENLSPHFQVPLTDRFNYASMDCSARVHLAHRSAKSPASILSSKRDRYMLSPCSSPKENQFVVVELCEDIRIDTVQLANFEFFSGVFKDFSVSVAKTYKEDWVDAGTYRAKNVRGVQSFHPPTSLTGFYRFIRIDFHTHYSNEYYCPISLLRVYGLTHLEEWKWEIWEAESRAKREELGEPSPPLEVVAEEPLPVHTPVSDKPEERIQATALDQATSPPLSNDSSSITKDDELSSSTVSQPTLTPFAWEQYATTTANEASNDIHSTMNDSPPTVVSTPAVALSSPSPAETANTTAVSSALSTVTSTPLSSSLPVVSAYQVHNPPPPPPATGGESIYRTIMNRLTALEANHTLYVRYVEEQTNGVREMIRRLGEDVGRLDGIGKAQAQKFQRGLKEWENQRKSLETEYNELVARVEYLSDEIVLEKRLGIAQLCLLLAVIVFMGVTRGSRGESLLEHGPLRSNQSMREWSRRHLSFSGDWVSRLTSSRSRSPTRNAKSPKPNDISVSQPVHRDDDHRVAFPALQCSPKAQKVLRMHLQNLISETED